MEPNDVTAGGAPPVPRWQLALLFAFRHGRRPGTALLTFLLSASISIVLAVTTALMAYDMILLAGRGQPAQITVEWVSDRNQNLRGTFVTGSAAGTEVLLDDSVDKPRVGEQFAVTFDPSQPSRVKDARIGWWRWHYLIPIGSASLASTIAVIHFRWWWWLHTRARMAHRDGQG
jgi:hypothetical protein